MDINQRYFWPPPPDEARIEWLKSYSSQLDIDKNAAQEFWASIAGDDAPKTLVKPIAVKSLPNSNKFFVSDAGRATVVVFDLEKHEMRLLEVPDGVPPLLLPISVGCDRSETIYVLERRSSSILVFDSKEKYQRTISLKSISISNPNAMFVDKVNDFIYVSDAATRKIYVIDFKGVVLASIGAPGDDDGQFNLPVSIAKNSKGNLLVADVFGANIQVFNSKGKFLHKFGKRGDAPGEFQLIKSIAVDSSDNVYVVDGRAHNITIFNESGEVLLVLGAFYAISETGKIAPGGFSLPIGIDIDSRDRIFVVDQMNARVQLFQYFSDENLQNKSGAY